VTLLFGGVSTVSSTFRPKVLVLFWWSHLNIRIFATHRHLWLTCTSSCSAFQRSAEKFLKRTAVWQF
jgi:hypothetical protein